MKAKMKKSVIGSTVLSVFLAVSLVSSNANAVVESNIRALTHITDAAERICLVANKHNATRTDIEVEGSVNVSNLFLKLLTIDGIGVNGAYRNSTQQGMLVDEITDDAIAERVFGGAQCALKVLDTLEDRLLIPLGQGGNNAHQVS